MGIAENIKILRDKHGISQVELAEIAGVSDKAVSTWENGINEPRMGAIQKIADHFGILKSNLIEDDGMLNMGTKKATLEEIESGLTAIYEKHGLLDSSVSDKKLELIDKIITAVLESDID